VALLRHSDAQALPALLLVRPLTCGLLHHLASDRADAALGVLKELSKRVIGNKYCRTSVSEALSDVALYQLASIAGNDAVGDDEAAAMAAALDILIVIGSDHELGFCAEPDSWQCGTLLCMARGTSQLTSGQHRLLRLLQRLQPSVSASHARLIQACAAHDPALAAALLVAYHVAAEPAPSARWLTQATIMRALLQAAARMPAGFRELAHHGAQVPEMKSKALQGLLHCVFPVCVPRTALSRGLQHSSSLVQLSVLELLVAVISLAGAVIKEANEAASIVQGSDIDQAELRSALWRDLAAAFVARAQASLPDPQPMLALLALHSSRRLTANDGSHGGLVFSAALRTLQSWQRYLPGALVAARVDAEKLLPQVSASEIENHPWPTGPSFSCRPFNAMTKRAFVCKVQNLLELPSTQQLQYLDLCSLALPSPTSAILGPGCGMQPRILQALHLLCSATEASVRSAAREWLEARLLQTGLFGGCREEMAVWLDVLPVVGSTAACSFLSEAVSSSLRRPDRVHEAVVAQNIGSGSGDECGGGGLSLLAVSALSQAIRVSLSTKASGFDRAAISWYAAACVKLVVQISPAPTSSARAVLQLMMAESGGQLGEDTEKERKRRRAMGGGATASLTAMLPAEAAALVDLARELEALMRGQGEEGQPLKKKARSTASAPGSSDHSPKEVPLCLLISEGMCGRNGDRSCSEALAAALEHIPGTGCLQRLSAARQCLYWLQRSDTVQEISALACVLKAALEASCKDGDSAVECWKAVSQPLEALLAAQWRASPPVEAVIVEALQLLALKLADARAHAKPGGAKACSGLWRLCDAARAGLRSDLEFPDGCLSASPPPSACLVLAVAPAASGAEITEVATVFVEAFSSGQRAALRGGWAMPAACLVWARWLEALGASAAGHGIFDRIVGQVDECTRTMASE
jgi:hypothetical protein